MAWGWRPLHLVGLSPRRASPLPDRPAVVVVGKESVGKSTLISRLTGTRAKEGNFRGTTVACERYEAEGVSYVDTPGILVQADTEATRLALGALDTGDVVLLVVDATSIREDLLEMLPLVRGRRGIVVVTHWDKVARTPDARDTIASLAYNLGTQVVPLDARRAGPDDLVQIRAAIGDAAVFPGPAAVTIVGWQIEPPPSVLDRRWLGPSLALGLLILPAVAAATAANSFAGRVDPLVTSASTSLVETLQRLPAPLDEILAGPYGIGTMGPLLVVWALPTIVVFAFLMGAYKASGLIDRVARAAHPAVRPFGLMGRDVVRVMMGLGCNVPAVLNTRACSSCTRDTCMSAIAFGSACSYQLGATIAVFGAAGRPELAAPFLAWLTLTTLVYLRLTAPAASRSAANLALVQPRRFLVAPSPAAVWREAAGTLQQFAVKALPIFLVITVAASTIAWLGLVDAVALVLTPVTDLVRLPDESAVVMLLAAIRKDGMLLFAEPGLAGQLGAVQLLTAVYLAGVLLPCVVTSYTIARERTARFALRLMTRQAAAAIVFSAVLAWVVAPLF